MEKHRDYHFWDMDHTLVGCDCEVSWKRFLVETGFAAEQDLELADRFFSDYAQGRLDAQAYLDFQLKDFQGRPVDKMEAMAEQHFQSRVVQHVYEGARQMVQSQLAADDLVVLLTATNKVIASPVARHFGIEIVVATEFDTEGGTFNGKLRSEYCLGPGKLARLQAYCGQNGIALSRVHYYGDSIPDLHVLKEVGFPVAVNPMSGLLRVAQEAGWRVIDFR